MINVLSLNENVSPTTVRNTKRVNTLYNYMQNTESKEKNQQLCPANKTEKEKNDGKRRKLRHNPRNIRFYANSNNVSLPTCLKLSQERFETVARLRSLRTSKKNLKKEIKENRNVSSWLKNMSENKCWLGISHSGNNNSRERRSESFENVGPVVLSFILSKTNLKKMEFGIYDGKNNFRNFGIDTIIEGCLCPRWTVLRVLDVLEKNEIIKRTKTYKYLNDGFRLDEYKIEVSENAFIMLGLYDQFLKDREYACRKFEEKQARLDKQQHKAQTWARKISFDRNQKTDKIKKSVQKLDNLIVKQKTVREKGNGEEALNEVRSLIAKGHTIADAMKIATDKYRPPPH